MTGRPARGRGVSAMAGMLMVALVVAGVFLWGLNHFAQGASALVPESPTERTDAIIVLTGGSNRLSEGFQILLDDKADRLFVSGVHRDVAVADLLAREGIDPGIWVDRVAIGQVALDTAGNAEETALWLNAEGMRSLRLVTSNYHMPRSLLEFRRALPDHRIISHPVVPEGIALGNWWRDPESATLLVREYVKYLYVATVGQFRRS